MLLYNLTTIIEDTAAAEWLTWTREQYVDAIMATGKFVSHRLLRVVDSPNEGVTFCLQFVAENAREYDDYQRLYAENIERMADEKFKNRSVCYRSLMEYI